MIDDVDLLRRYVETGSEEAFTELVHRHIDFVYSAALRMTKSTHRAEDVTQNVFTDLCRKAKNLTHRQGLVGWLYISTRYASTILIRRECRRELREHEAHLLSEQSSESACAIDWKQLAPVLDHVLGKLSTPDRDAILLRFFKNASFAEIGAALQLSENGARMRVNRAVSKARKLLARRGVSSTAVALELALSAQPAVAAPAAFVSGVSGTAMVAAASGATAATTAAGLLALMNTSKLAIGIAASVGLFSVGTGVYYAISQKRACTQTQAAIFAADDDLLRMQSRLAGVTGQSANAEKDRARLEKIETGLRELARNAIKEGQSTAKPVKAGPDLKALAKDPAYEAAYISNFRASLRSQYAALYRQQGLTPEQVQRFENALAIQRWADFEVAASAADQGISLNDPSLKDLYDENRKDMLAALQGIVAVQQLFAYQDSLSGRDVVNQLAAPLSYTDAPLTPQQSTSMVQLISAHTDHESGVVDWTQVMAEAPGVLSPSQVSMLGAVQARIQYNQAYSEVTRNGNVDFP